MKINLSGKVCKSGKVIMIHESDMGIGLLTGKVGGHGRQREWIKT